MPRIFISYSRQDLAVVQRVEQALTANGFSVWRDQESLYGGQQWPKEIGEAIATSDYFLLLWSNNAADSHFVEFEWTTAIALGKAIIPCLLHDTPLPSSLRGIHGIDVTDLQEALPRLLTALQTPLPEPAPERHSSEVINKLQRIAVTDPEQVLTQVKSIFNQEGWNIQGNVYHAAGDIFLTIQQSHEQP